VAGQATATVDPDIDHLAYLVEPSAAIAGEALDPAVQVEVRDAGGSRVADAGVPVTLSLGANPGGGALSGTKTVNAINGVASYTGLSIERSGVDYTLVASSTGIIAATSAGFDIAAAAPAMIGYLPVPGTSTAGEPLGFGVAVQDQFGNTVTTETDPVTIVLESAPAGGVLVGTTTESAVDGVAVFDGVTIEVAGAGYAVEAAASGFSSITSGPFDVTHAAADHLGLGQFTFIPGGDARLNMDFVEVAIRDVFGNVVDNSTAEVTLALTGAEYPGGTVSGNLIVNALNGVADFDDVSIDKPGEYYFLASSAGVTDTTVTVGVIIRPGPNLLGAGTASVGTDHSCVTTRGGPFCFGSNASGRLGGPTLQTRDSVAVAVDVADPFDVVSAGGEHSCGISENGEAYCWGENGDGQLGDGSGFDQPSAVAVSTGESMAWISAGDRHSCGVSNAGYAYCWGANDQGQLGTGAAGAGTNAPVQVTDSILFNTVHAGVDHTCGWAQDSVAYCWGDNSRGQLGDDNLGIDSPSPVLVDAAGLKFAAVDVGSDHSCVIEDGGDVYCWGANDVGQLGDGGMTDSDVPVMIKTVSLVPGYGIFFGTIGAGDAHTCVVNGPGAGVSCWGDDSSGQLGLGGFGLVANSTFVQYLGVWAGGGHTCGYVDDLDGLIEPDAGDGLEEGFRCWGRNAEGQLGDGTLLNRAQPTAIFNGIY
jgi:alpha-tubulin suppressor-like RCC1 family protein